MFFKPKKVEFSRIPNHIAFIIDGNGRWATKRGLPRIAGHTVGIDAVQKTIENCCEIGIKIISFFAFSTENWNRPQEEVYGIFELLRKYIESDADNYKDKGIKFIVSGDISPLPNDLKESILKILKMTENCDKTVVNICLNYGGRADIVNAFNHMIVDGVKLADEKTVSKYLYTSSIPDPDFVIRTSGEQRISNFMLYQMAYSELYFTKQYWPDFDKKSLITALESYQTRNRKFGAIKK